MSARLETLPAYVIGLGLLMPSGVAFQAGTVGLPLYRLIVMAMLPFVFWNVTKMKRWTAPDRLMLLLGLWFLIVTQLNSSNGIQTGVINLLDTCVGYFAVRTGLTTFSRLRRALRISAIVVAILGAIIALESILQRPLVAMAAHAVTGSPVPYMVVRKGLARAAGPFIHPIHAGIFCGSFFSLFLYGVVNDRWRRFGVIGTVVGSFFTVSSGAWFGLILQWALGLYRWVTLKMGVMKRWLPLVAAIALFWMYMDVASNRGFLKFFLATATLDPSTSQYRIAIWTYAGPEALRHFWTGVGYGQWERPIWMTSDSVDAFWLAEALFYGMPASIIMGLASLWMLFLVGRQMRGMNLPNRKLMLAWMYSFIGFLLSGFTVYFWAALFVWYFMFLGIGAGLLEAAKTARDESRRRPIPPQPLPPSQPGQGSRVGGNLPIQPVSGA